MNYITYKNILDDIKNFRRVGEDKSNHDTPAQKYFKIFFHFENEDYEGNDSHTGLLAPTWMINNILGSLASTALLSPSEPTDYYAYNSAWAYLKMNKEDERAEMLKEFVNLLSNISSDYPWYFMELGGLDQAIERKQVTDRDFKIEDSNKRLTIKCLPDAYDDRISTLLDLYRSIVWSWQWKREVLPANLRKFDMSVMIFDAPTRPYSNDSLSLPAVLGHDDNPYSQVNLLNRYQASYKLYEFHNCEIDYNSSKSGVSTINNGQGVQPEYTIEISYDDCYESRYNEFLVLNMGDVIKWDNDPNSLFIEQSDIKKYAKRLINQQRRTIRSNVITQLVGSAIDDIGDKVKSMFLGNIFGFSLSELGRNVKDLLTGGNLLNTIREGVEFWREQKTKKLNPWELDEEEIREEIGSLNLSKSNSNLSDSDRDYADHINNMNQPINITLRDNSLIDDTEKYGDRDYNDHINNMNQPITETLSDNSLIDDTEEYGNRDYNDHINNMNQPITEKLRDNSLIDDTEEYGDRDYNDHINNMNKKLNINIFKKGVKYVNNQSMKLNGISIANNL